MMRTRTEVWVAKFGAGGFKFGADFPGRGVEDAADLVEREAFQRHQKQRLTLARRQPADALNVPCCRWCRGPLPGRSRPPATRPRGTGRRVRAGYCWRDRCVRVRRDRLPGIPGHIRRRDPVTPAGRGRSAEGMGGTLQSLRRIPHSDLNGSSWTMFLARLVTGGMTNRTFHIPRPLGPWIGGIRLSPFTQRGRRGCDRCGNA